MPALTLILGGRRKFLNKSKSINTTMLKYSIKGSSLFKYGVWLRCDFIVFFLELEMHDTPSTINNHFFNIHPKCRSNWSQCNEEGVGESENKQHFKQNVNMQNMCNHIHICSKACGLRYLTVTEGWTSSMQICSFYCSGWWWLCSSLYFLLKMWKPKNTSCHFPSP